MTSKIHKYRAEMSARAYNMTLDMGQTLRHARKAMGLRPSYIAQCVNVSEMDWMYYESNKKPVPMHIIMRLLMFGMDFWARNKQCFDKAKSDTPPAGQRGN